MAAPAAVQSSYIPAILLQQAQLDNIPVARLIEQVRTAVDAIPAPELLEPEPAREQEPCTLPLLDANGLLCRKISESEAWRLIDAGNALGLMAVGWDTDRRRDLPLLSVQLRVPRAAIQWSNCAISDTEMHLIAGEEGHTHAARAAKAKLSVWLEIH